MEVELIKIFELLAFVVASSALVIGALCLFKKNVPKYFRLYVYAVGCYVLEELWVIVNALLGTGKQDGLVTVRLFGFFGCLCFLLSAANELNGTVDTEKNRRVDLLSLTAPAVLLISYALYAFSPINADQLISVIIGLVSISPALFASRLSLKHLLSGDTDGRLKVTMGTNVTALIFYAANYLYPLTNLYCDGTVMGIYDLGLSALLFVAVMMCIREASKWETLT